jgi:Asp-tRNA(Asn)/Glu-tRNA(Gln) amidotransferase A subunit family amidase
VTVALGSDTGGSIRIPASVCGAVGIKPTYGRAPRTGVASLSWSLDHVGPLTRNVREAALVMAAMSGYYRRDPASVNRPVPDWTGDLEGSIEGTRIGIPTNFYNERVQQEIWDASMVAADELVKLGAELVGKSFPRLRGVDPAPAMQSDLGGSCELGPGSQDQERWSCGESSGEAVQLGRLFSHRSPPDGRASHPTTLVPRLEWLML